MEQKSDTTQIQSIFKSRRELIDGIQDFINSKEPGAPFERKELTLWLEKRNLHYDKHCASSVLRNACTKGFVERILIDPGSFKYTFKIKKHIVYSRLGHS